MYNAMANTTTVDCKGTTRLHMDMSDALNVMTFAATSPDGSPGCAAWDIFKSDDSNKIREYLREYAKKVQSPNMKLAPFTDPIHTQQFYLDDNMRKELERRGVFSFRIYQRPNEAVFVPAGCAHQVRLPLVDLSMAD
jgi:[histone H3]-dimethyl-L-lysine9 demethylase